MGNTAKQCRLGLFQDTDFVGDVEDSKSTSGGTLCVFGSRTFVPISWMCEKQTAVSHSSTESHAFVGKVVEMLVTQTQERMQQVANAHVQHVASTVKVERPKIIMQTVQKIVIDQPGDQAHRGSAVPDEVVDMLDAVQRQASMVQKILKITVADCRVNR